MTKTTALTIPQIIAGTFVATGEATKTHMGDVTPGTIKVQFGDEVITTRAERLVRYAGFTIDRAFGFESGTKTGKYTYAVSVSHRVEDDEHNCQIGSSLKASKIIFKGE